MIQSATKKISAIFLATFFLSLHLGITAYSNSSFMSSFGFSDTLVSLVYIVGALLTITGLLLLPRLIEKRGNIKVLNGLIITTLILLALLHLTELPWLVLAIFPLYFTIIALILFEMDIFLEHFSHTGNTGRIRGIYLSIINLAWTISPFFAGYSIDRFGLSSVYALGFGTTCIAFLIVLLSFKNIRFKKTHRHKLKEMYRHLRENKDVFSIFLMSTLMNFFFAIMVIYTPLHLNLHLGFSWAEIGLIFTIMHLPYIFLEYPIGRLADTWIGEKEMLFLGLIIAGLAAGSFFFVESTEFTTWLIILVISRVGMSLVETTTESYFFKKIEADDISTISTQRLAGPLGYTLAPLCGLIIVSIFNSSTAIFLFLGIVMISGIGITRRLHDTK